MQNARLRMSLKDDDDDSTAFAKNQSPDIPQEHNEMLSCTALGGPDKEFVNREMVYWDHIDSDLKYISPFKRNNEVQYLTFEPDQGYVFLYNTNTALILTLT